MTWAFNALDFEPTIGIENWPEGWWPVVISKAEEKPNRDEDGFLWELTIKGLPGSPVADKIQFIRINHKHPKQDWVANAHKTMSAIALCCGVPQFQHPGQVTNIPFMVKSSLTKGGKNEDGSDKPIFNNFRDFKNMAGVEAIDIYKQMKGIAPAATAGAPQSPQGFGQQPQQGFQPQQGGGFVQPGQQPMQPQQQFQPQQPQQQFQQPQQQFQPDPNAGNPNGMQPMQPQGQPMQPQQPQAGGWPGQQPQGQQFQPAGVQPGMQPQGGQPGQPMQAGSAPWGQQPQG